MSLSGAVPEAKTAPARPAERLASLVRWTLMGTIANSAGTWLLTVFLARSSGPDAVGSYALALALTAPIMSLVGLQIRTLLASDPRQKFAFGEYFRVSLGTTALGVLACIVFAQVAGSGGVGWAALGAVCVARAAEAIAEVYMGLWQQHERLTVVGLSRVLQAIASVVFVAIACALGAGVTGTAAAYAFGSVLLLLFMQNRTKADPSLRALTSPPVLSWQRLGALVLQGAPLGGIALLAALQANVPRYFIELHVGKTQLGLFAAAAQLTSSGTILIGALGSAALPRLAAASASGSAAFRSLTRRLALVGAGLGVAGVALSALLGREVLVLVYRPEFGEADQVLLVLSVAAGFSFVAGLLGYALTAARVILSQSVSLVATIAVMAGSCILLVPRHGAVGAAWAVVLGSAVNVVGSVLAFPKAKPSGD